jgi:hypothetical protein
MLVVLLPAPDHTAWRDIDTKALEYLIDISPHTSQPEPAPIYEE